MDEKVLSEGVEDLSKTPDRLRTLIDSGQCSALVNFHLLDNPDGSSKIAMFAAGLTQRDIFNVACVIRRSMMMMLGFEEREVGVAAQGDLAPDLVADDEPARHPDACQACGRDYWQVLAKCEHAGCPKGLYVA